MTPVVVVGSYNTGLTMLVRRIPRSGETLLGRGYAEGPGGKGSNQAVAAARLGGRVSFVGCVGRDRFGDQALELWKKEGVDARHVKRSSKHTGLGFVTVDDAGSNAISVDPGANQDLGVAEVEDALRDATKGTVLLLQLEIPMRTVRAAIRAGEERGMLVILNPAPPSTSGRLSLQHVDVLTPNEAEFSALTGRSSLKRGSELLLRRGAGAVVVTLGAKGAFVSTGEESYSARPPRVSAADTTGAGDAFNGALAVALSEGTSLRDAVGFANAAGALTVTKREVIPALPTRDEVERLMRRLRR